MSARPGPRWTSGLGAGVGAEHPPARLLPSGGDLHYHLSQHGVFSEADMRFYAAEIDLFFVPVVSFTFARVSYKWNCAVITFESGFFSLRIRYLYISSLFLLLQTVFHSPV